jgi:hypothetical protein
VVSTGAPTPASFGLRSPGDYATFNSNQTPDGTLNANGDLVFVSPAYTFATPVLGGQAAITVGGLVGHSGASVAGALTASLDPFTTMRCGNISDSVTGIDDLYPQA